MPPAADLAAAALSLWLVVSALVGSVAGALAWHSAFFRASRELEDFLLGDCEDGREWGDHALGRKRRALEAAIAAKFGPLDAARRGAIQTYDQGRIAEAARRLPDAAKIEGLDG